MKNLNAIAGTAACALALLVAAPAAMASGGKPATAPSAGGGTTSTTATSPATGGGGGGGGVGSKGGVKDPTVVSVPAPPPAPLAPPCATFTSVTAPVGYYSIWAAVWNDFTIRNCSLSAHTYSVHVTETDSSGLVGYDVTVPYAVAPNQNVSGILDNDFAPFNTTYAITMSVSDESGNVLDSQSLSATTGS